MANEFEFSFAPYSNMLLGCMHESISFSVRSDTLLQHLKRTTKCSIGLLPQLFKLRKSASQIPTEGCFKDTYYYHDPDQQAGNRKDELKIFTECPRDGKKSEQAHTIPETPNRNR